MKFFDLTKQIEIVLIVVACGSFLLSYNNLHTSAVEMGVPSILAFVFPICIDAFLLICTLYILYSGQNNVDPREGWGFLFAYTIASIAFNIHMAPSDIWAQFGYSMCPVGLCVSLHFFMKVIHTEIEKKKLLGKSDESIVLHVKNGTIDKVVDVLNPPEQIEESIETSQEIEQILTTRDIILKYFETVEKGKIADAATNTGFSYKTCSKYIKIFVEEGLLEALEGNYYKRKL